MRVWGRIHRDGHLDIHQFQGYASPTESRLPQLLRRGISGLGCERPTRSLQVLRVYHARFPGRSRCSTDHLWVPHQALAEFWRNRESVMRNPGPDSFSMT
jgi:hypothetical protein